MLMARLRPNRLINTEDRQPSAASPLHSRPVAGYSRRSQPTAVLQASLLKLSNHLK